MAEYFDLPPLEDDSAPVGSRDAAIIEWCEAKYKQGRTFIENSIGYEQIEHNRRAIFALENNNKAVGTPAPLLSKTRVNLTAKTAEELTALLTDTKVFWNYSTHNPKYQKQVDVENKSAESWYTSNCIDLRLADGIRMYTYAGTGVFHFFFSRSKNDLAVEAIDPRNVFPIEPASYHSFQDCLGVVLVQPRTPQWIRSEYDKIVHPETGPTTFWGWMMNIIKGPRKTEGPLGKIDGHEGIPATPTCFMKTLYIKDPRVNKTAKPMYMGKWQHPKPSVAPPNTLMPEMMPEQKSEPLSSFSYIVQPGAPMYPLNRMIVWSHGVLLYDGPAPYWHAKFPLLKLTLNPWPGSWFGKAPLTDIAPLEYSVNHNLRIVDDHNAQVAQPGVIGDRNVSEAALKKFNSRLPGWNIRQNSASGKGIQVINPPTLDDNVWKTIEYSERKIQQLSGTADVSQLATLNQIPSDDTIESMMRAMTPGIRLRSRILEGFMKEFAEMFMYNDAQFHTFMQRIQKFGPDAATAEDFDYDKFTMVPDNIPDGTPGDIGGFFNAIGNGPETRYQRAQLMFKSWAFNYKPGSLLNSAGNQDRMEAFLLSRQGYISWFTLMQKLGWSEGSLVPPGEQIPADELSRIQKQAAMGLGMAVSAQGRKATDGAPPSMGQNAAGPTIQTS